MRFVLTAGLLLTFICGLSACGGGDNSGDNVPSAKVEEYQIDSAVIDESSGLARSHRDSGILWTHNDSGGKAETYAVDLKGHFLGTLAVFPAINLDWEDMSSFIENGTPRLLLADMGDNNAFRPFITLYIVDEPDLSAQAKPFSLQATVVRSIQVLYPDGPRDAESIAVDAAEGYIYILSKRDAVPRLYRVPLAPVLPIVIAEALGEINVPRAPAGAQNPDSINWVTSMDLSEDLSRIAVVGPLHAHLYSRGAGESWQTALLRAPQELDLPDYSQIEGCTFSGDGKSLWITSEGEPAPLARIPLQ
jgi:hypothetical protein